MNDQIEFGISRRLLHGAADEAHRAEALGFDYLLTGEHIMFHGPSASTMVSLAAAAGATERIKLMSGITLAPLYPPALLAKQAAVLDVVSGGRFHLGIGVGGEFPKEFAAVGVPVHERGVRTNEALEVIDKLLREEDVHFERALHQARRRHPATASDPKAPNAVLGGGTPGRGHAARRPPCGGLAALHVHAGDAEREHGEDRHVHGGG